MFLDVFCYSGEMQIISENALYSEQSRTIVKAVKAGVYAVLFLPLAVIKLLTRVWEPSCCVGAEVHMPPTGANRILSWLFSLEAPLIARIDFPFGLSVLAILRK